jgi:hypothetical protein
MSMTLIKQVSAKKAHDVACAVKDTGCKLPAPAKTESPSSNKESALVVDLFKLTESPGGPSEQSAGKSISDKALGVLALMKMLVSVVGYNKVAFEQAVSKSMGLEEGRVKNEEVLTKRTKLAITNALNLANNQLSLPILALATTAKLPPAIKLKQPEGLKHESATT